MKPVRLLVFVWILFSFSSCAGRTDRDIETDVSVNFHPSAPNITVRAENGVVLLSGVVKDSASWQATVEAAKSTQGVKSVDDKLHIVPPKPVK